MISNLDDYNEDNHAYTKRRGCLTAIVETQKKLLQAKNKKNSGFYGKIKVFSIISCDDISGAFESIDHILVAYALEIIFSNDPTGNVADFLKSYLQRKSFVVGDSTNELFEVIRILVLKTAPQGSLLSPILWRIYDGIFVYLYKNNIAVLVESDKSLVCISHVAYADDHITIITFVMPEESTKEQIGRKMSEMFKKTRALLCDATKQLGCGVNPLKSENVVPPEFVDFIDLNLDEKDPDSRVEDNSFYGKSLFKWLGYWLNLTSNHQLVFDKVQTRNRINMVHDFRSRIFQYTSNISLKWKIYKAFITPFIELYLPIVIQHGLDSNTLIHQLQYRSMCKALNLDGFVNREKLEIKLGEKSVVEKAKSLCIRLIDTLKIAPEIEENITMKRLRNRNIYPIRCQSAKDRKTFLNRMFYYRDVQTRETKKVKFNKREVLKYTKEVNRKIKEKIIENRAKN